MSNVTAPQHLVKQPGERRIIKFNFADALDTGESISGVPTVTSTTVGGETSDLFISEVSIVGEEVHCFIASGTHTYRYRLESTINTSTGQILQGDGILRVTDI